MKDISKSNLKDLEAIRGIIEIETGEDVTVDQVLTRILDFYQKFVPFG